eukprot:jgi/Tetstr1/439001/TSEL_027493.t1
MASLSGRGLEGDGVTEAKLRLLEARLTGGGRGETVPVTTVVTNVVRPRSRSSGRRGRRCRRPADSLAQSRGVRSCYLTGRRRWIPRWNSEPSDEEEKAEGRERMVSARGGGSLGGWGIHSVGGNTSKRMREEKETLSARVEAAEKAASAAEAEAAALRADLEEAQSAAAAREEAALRLGSIGVERAGALMTEVWVDGPAFTDISPALPGACRGAAKQVDALKKSLKNQLPLPDGSARKGVVPISQEEFLTRSEVLKAKLVALKREEERSASVKRSDWRRLRIKHIRQAPPAGEAKRRKDEEDSRFINTAVLNGRYALMDMLGKAASARASRTRAWWLSPTSLKIDHNTFATVLEVCLGGDLEGHLREHGSLPEKEAKAIVAQILQGLAYLNDPGRRIIHYDLKPANILFDSFGEVKITDFG